MRIVDVSRRPDLDDYLRRTASGELLWTLHGTVYEAHDDHETLTLHREHRVLHLTMNARWHGARVGDRSVCGCP